MTLSSQGRADILYGIVAIMGGTALFAHTFSDRYDNDFLFGDVSTVFVPRLLLGMIILLSLGLVLKGVRNRDGAALPKIMPARVMAVFTTLTVATAGVWFIGYLIAMPIGVFLIGWAFGYPNKLVLAITALVAPIVTWLVLGEFAHIAFPTSKLF